MVFVTHTYRHITLVYTRDRVMINDGFMLEIQTADKVC